jgi:hypothetical protein
LRQGLYSSGWPQTQNPPVLAFLVLGLYAWDFRESIFLSIFYLAP